jgi:hypothetical protein
MITANQDVFRLLAAAAGNDVSAERTSEARAISTNADDKNWLKHLKIVSSPDLVIDSTSQFAIAALDDYLYLICVAVDVVAPPPELKPIELNAGIFTAIIHELDIPIIRQRALDQSLREYVFYPTDSPCEMFEWTLISQYFPEIRVFRISPDSAISQDPQNGLRAAIAAVIGAPSSRPMNWCETSLDRLSVMIRDPDERAPFQLLLRALTERRGDAVFLSLYRCLEQLFPIPVIDELSTELNISTRAIGVAAAIEKHLGWRRREEDALVQLFASLEGQLIEKIKLLFDNNAQMTDAHAFAAKSMYRLRNNSVHFRPAHSQTRVSAVADGPSLWDAMLEVIQVLYARYRDAFEEREKSVPAVYSSGRL